MATPLLPFDTRQAAHATVLGSKQETCTQILRYAYDRGTFGIMPDEVAEDFGCSHNHSSPRCSELVKAGLLVRTKRTRQTRAGCPARVLVHFEFARADDRAEVTVAERSRMPGQGKGEGRG